MADENVGSIVYQVDMDTSELIAGSRQVQSALSSVEDAASKTSKSLDGLDSSSASAGAAIGSMSKSTGDINSSFRALNTTAASVSKALADNRAAASSASSEFSKAEALIESLGNQFAILEEAQQGSARSAAILAAQLRAGDSATESQKKEIADLTGRLYDMRNGVDVVQKGSKSLGGTFGQLGYQVQDIAVQLQGGQNALLVFGQQGSQIASIFGPGGAVLGAVLAVGSALAAALIPNLMKSGSEIDNLRKAAEDLNKVVTISSSGVAALSNDYALLAKTNAVVAAQLRDNAIAEYQKKVEDAGKAVRDVVKDQSSWFGSLSGGSASVLALGEVIDTLNIKTDNFRDAFQEASKVGVGANNMAATLNATVSMLSGNLGISDQAAFGLAKQLNELAKNPTEQNITAIINSLKGMKSSSKEGQQAIDDLLASVTNAGAGVLTAAARVDQLKKSLNDLQTAAQAQNFENLSRSLKQQTIQLTQGAQAAKEFAISQEDLTDEQKAQLIQQSRQVNALEEQKKAQDEAARSAASSAKSRAEGEKKVAEQLEDMRQKSELAGTETESLARQRYILSEQQKLGQYATENDIKLAGEYAAKAFDQQQAEKKLQEEIKRKAEAQKNFQSIQASVSPVAAVDNKFQSDMQQLNQYATMYPQKIEEIEATRAAIEEKYRKDRVDAMFEEWSQQSALTMAAAAAFESFGQTAGNALTGLITGSMSLSEALRSIGSNILSSVINAFVQLGVEWLKSFIVGQAGMAASVATGIAGATALATAWAPAAALSSLATAGANAVPAQTGLVATAGVAQGLAVAGLRKNGGPVSSGSMYQVGEGGAPEIFKASSGKQYMIPGDDGSVISNKDLGSSSSSGMVIYNNVTNNSSAAVSTTATDNGDGTISISTLVSDINEGGPLSQAIENNYTTRRRATE